MLVAIEENTSLDNDGERFHPAVAYDRSNEHCEILETWDESIQGKMLAKAREIVKFSQTVEPDVHSYVLDLGIDERSGEVIMIERNGFTNAGRFATNEQMIVNAVRSADCENPDTHLYDLILDFTMKVADPEEHKQQQGDLLIMIEQLRDKMVI